MVHKTSSFFFFCDCVHDFYLLIFLSWLLLCIIFLKIIITHKAWAKHKDHEIENPPNYKKLKGNFRCAMRKSNDFEEVENEKTLQRGNFKLYRLLTKEEVEKSEFEIKQKKN